MMPTTPATPVDAAPFPSWPRWLLWLAYVAAWTTALLVPMSGHPAGLELPPDVHFWIAKTVHVSAYLVLAVLSGWLQVPRPYRWWLLVFISLHAVGTEFGQQFVPTRHPSARDVALDHFGAILGVLATRKWWFSRP